MCCLSQLQFYRSNGNPTGHDKEVSASYTLNGQTVGLYPVYEALGSVTVNLLPFLVNLLGSVQTHFHIGKQV